MDEFNARELARKYTNTLSNIKALDTGKESTVYFRDFEIGSTVYALTANYIIPKEKNDRILGYGKQTNQKINVDTFRIVPPPEPKVFDSKGYTKLFMRSPQRQWQRGVNSHNSWILNPLHDILYSFANNRDNLLGFNAGGGVSNQYTLEHSANLFINNYPSSFKESLEDIDELKLLSRCINEKYFISLFPHKDKQYVLNRLQIPLAFYNRDRNEFKLINELYRQELQDFNRRNNIFAEIRI